MLSTYTALPYCAPESGAVVGARAGDTLEAVATWPFIVALRVLKAALHWPDSLLCFRWRANQAPYRVRRVAGARAAGDVGDGGAIDATVAELRWRAALRSVRLVGAPESGRRYDESYQGSCDK